MVTPDRSEMVVAAFDVDGTLTRRDCVVPFLARLAGRRRLVASSLRHPALLAATALGRGDRDRLKELVAGGLVRGVPLSTVNAVGNRFARETAAHWLRDDTLARLHWHRNAGHRVVLVSASFRAYLEPLAREVLGGVDAVISTELETDADGRCTGRLAGGNCRGPEKSRRLVSWLAGRPAEVWAYGDSAGDDELLAMARHPVRVRGVTIPAVPTAGVR